MSAKRLRPGLARVEFYAVRQEAVELLKQGHTYTSAFEVLKKAGKITMSYWVFLSYATGRRERLKQKVVVEEVQNQQLAQLPAVREASKEPAVREEHKGSIVPVIQDKQSCFDNKTVINTTRLITGKES